MIQLTTQPVGAPLEGLRAVGPNPQISADFSLVLAAAGVSGDGEIAPPEGDAAPVAERQVPADPGKVLPLAALPLSDDDLAAIVVAKPTKATEPEAKPIESDGRKRKRGANDTPAELLVQPPVVTPQPLPAPVEATAGGGQPQPQPIAIVAPQLADTGNPTPLEKKLETAPETLKAADPALDQAKDATQPARHFEAKILLKAPSPAFTVAPSLEVSSVPRPASEAFAAAMFATAQPAKPAARRAGDPLADALAITATDSKAATPIAIHAPAEAQGAPLDTRREEWMGKMIEHIETLQGEGGVRETRMRLAPEALGPVNVTIRHDGDKVSVQLTAETPAARALLAESAPRLAELAEARGLKLDTGAGQPDNGAGSSRRNDTPLVESIRPASALSDEIETSGPAEGRIA